ncbi:MAG: DUF805 domain-containing protein [Bacteroidales bacterium]|nr:DUF805 domain-containing protein [Bacteroidales bacterium]
MRWFIKCIRQYSDFNGRARRKEFWMFSLVQFILGLILFTADVILFVLPSDAFPILTMLYVTFAFFPSLAVAVRRLHDIGKSAWWYVKVCLTIYVVTIVLAILFAIGGVYSIDILTYISMAIFMVMYIGSLAWVIVVFCKNSEPNENKWGLNPKDSSTPEEDIVNIDCFKYFVKCFKQYVDFHGRASRAEFWMFFGVCYMAQLVFSIVMNVSQGVSVDAVNPISLIYLVYLMVIFIPSLAVGVRRLHDIGKSGWYLAGALILAVILAFAIGLAIAFKSNVVAIVSMILLIALILAFYIVPALKGQPGENKWGPNPNEENNLSETINENTIE